MKILFIEDEPATVEPLIDELTERFGSFEHEITGFSEAEDALTAFQPDMVVLDIFEGPAMPDGSAKGLGSYRFIWDACFCPVVVFSARPDDVRDKLEKHPFVQLVQKGSGREMAVADHIAQFRPHIDALARVKEELRLRVNQALQHVAPFAMQQDIEPSKASDFLVRAARRRVAASMDESLSSDEEPLASWEHYIFRPIASHLLTGDVIRRREGSPDDPGDFAVVLTPSCDLACAEGRESNVGKALVARCENVIAARRQVNAGPDTGEKKLKEKLLPLLTHGYGSWSVPMPALVGVVPPMVAVLRNLQLIDLTEIGVRDDTDRVEYVRVASLDSPFREMIAWAYIQVAGRPGLPERNCDTWAEEIWEALSALREEDPA